MQYYSSASEIFVYNFYKIIDEGDYRYLAKKHKEGKKTIIDEKKAEAIFVKIIEEYSELAANKETLIGFKLQISIADFEFERDCLENILNIFKDTGNLEVLNLLTEFNFTIRPNEDIDALLKSVISRIKNLNNKIRINKVKYTKRFKKEKAEIKRNLDKEALMLEMSLELGRKIDTRTTTLLEWVNIIDVSKEKAKRLESLKNK